jgi:hypothetical protein
MNERARLDEDRRGIADWRKWGPYPAERQWGTVREDYSPDGSAWDHFPHDHARSRAYRWGEDGIAGISDAMQRLCFSLALWNGADPILKERLFGLTGPEGNHGEDVKELYYYLDATPTHAYLKMLYKYPQRPFPYAQLVEESRRRGKDQPEFELIDTGVFAEGRYFDVFVEYAKAEPNDILIRISAHNRGPAAAKLHLLPQVFFRNTWSWTSGATRPRIVRDNGHTVALHHEELGEYRLYCDGQVDWLFTDNDTNAPRLFGQALPPGERACFKDAFHEYVVHHNESAIHPGQEGTKAAGWRAVTVPAGDAHVMRLRLCEGTLARPWRDFDATFERRIAEADAFHAEAARGIDDADARAVQRQAHAGLIWSRQFYHLDMPQWRQGDPAQPAPPPGRSRNLEWAHLNNADVLTMPDKWEYPYYCAWDSAIQCVAIAGIDPEWAKRELVLLTREWYMHPSGQLPAYEWAFGDVNPPVHAWAAWRVYEIERERTGRGDRAFLERVFHKLLLNFTWWVNRKDVEGHNVFQGGFLGLDNIGVFDRSAALPTGGHISQADGTSWMAMYCLNLMRIALGLARENPIYQDTATKFFEHFLYIAAAMTNIGCTDHCRGVDLWDKQDEFFYDVLSLPPSSGGQHVPLKVRSMVGLIPLFAVEVLDADLLAQAPEFQDRLEWFLKYRPDLASLVSRWKEPGKGDTRLLSLLRGHRMKRLLRRMLDPNEFLSDFGVRALSKHHLDHPYTFHVNGSTSVVRYTPGESDTHLFGGNSNWRGPVWFPVNYLLIESLRKFHSYYGDDFKVECPTGSGRFVTIREAADDLSRRLVSIFTRGADNRRPVFGNSDLLQRDPHFRNHVLFHEYFHGDSGRGVGASHQTGWTALVAKLLSAAGPARQEQTQLELAGAAA